MRALQSLRIDECFTALPAAGVVPAAGAAPLEQGPEPFFQNVALGRPVLLAERHWRRLLDLALGFEAALENLRLQLVATEANVVSAAHGQTQRWVLFASEALACAASAPVRQFLGGSQAAATPGILEQILANTARLYAALALLLTVRAGRELAGALALAQACNRCSCLADAIASGARADAIAALLEASLIELPPALGALGGMRMEERVVATVSEPT
jgi:hypothetical protein